VLNGGAAEVWLALQAAHDLWPAHYHIEKGVLMSTTALTPRQPVPALNVPLVTGGQFVLGEKPAAKFDLVVVYRGLHCPICA